MRSKDFKQRAKEALKGNWFKAIIASFIASVFGATYGAGGFNFTFDYSDYIFDNTVPEQEGTATVLSTLTQTGNYEDGHIAALLFILEVFVFGAIVAGIISMIISCIVRVGYAQFNLDLINGADAKIGTLFSRANQFGVVLRSQILIFLRVYLGYIFFIIPGIVMTYSYAMTDFVLADNPGMNAREALAESRRIMRGNRWKLFCLSLSFIGLSIICAFTFGIGLIWLVPYMEASVAAFYLEAKANA